MDSHLHKLLLAKLCFGILIATQAVPPVSGDCDFPAIFNFGDSNSDTGGYSATFGQARAPAGETYFGEPAGRYSDGRLIIDFIAQSLGLPLLHSYLDSVGFNYSHGANFATAASTIRMPHVTAVSPFYLGLQQQQFTQLKNRSQAVTEQVFKDLLPKEDYFSRALYTFDIGQNDLAYSSGVNADEAKTSVPDILNKFAIVVKTIYEQGGRSFWTHNTGPFGCLPYIIDQFPLKAAQVDRAGCGSPFNSVAKYFNEKLKKLVFQLRKDLPLAAITYVDIYSLKYAILSNAKKYGFKHPLKACCGHGGKYNYNIREGCGSTIYVNGTATFVGSCKDPSVAIIWDGVHYTEAANKWVFNQIVDGTYSEPPIALRMACHREAK